MGRSPILTFPPQSLSLCKTHKCDTFLSSQFLSVSLRRGGPVGSWLTTSTIGAPHTHFATSPRGKVSETKAKIWKPLDGHPVPPSHVTLISTSVELLGSLLLFGCKSVCAKPDCVREIPCRQPNAQEGGFSFLGVCSALLSASVRPGNQRIFPLGARRQGDRANCFEHPLSKVAVHFVSSATSSDGRMSVVLFQLNQSLLDSFSV